MSLPTLPPRIADALKKAGLESFTQWFQTDFQQYMNATFHTLKDATMITPGKGVVLTNTTGTVTKRVRLNSAGDGLIFEDV